MIQINKVRGVTSVPTKPKIRESLSNSTKPLKKSKYQWFSNSSIKQKGRDPYQTHPMMLALYVSTGQNMTNKRKLYIDFSDEHMKKIWINSYRSSLRTHEDHIPWTTH